MISKKSLSSKFAVVGLLALLVFLSDLKFRQWQTQQQIEAEEADLQNQANSLEKQNQDLNQSLQYLNSPSFKERVARQQLGLKKDGENVYSFGQQASSSAPTTPQYAQNSPDAVKWWNYFFGVQ